VRHAEKADDGTPDPPLTDVGKARADLLASMLARENISAIYSTPYKRTRATVQPIATRLEKEVIEYDPRRPFAELLEDLLQKHNGGTVLICGHSNTIPGMVNELVGSEDFEQLDEKDYDNLYVVTATKVGVGRAVNLVFTP
jgi:broad specificity phosphatase PhoE